MNVLITEGMHEEGIRMFQQAGLRVWTLADIVSAKDVEVIVVRSVFNVDAAALDLYPSVKIVAKLGTGLDNIDQALCTRKGIAVLSTPGMNAVSTAEFAVAQILNIFKNSFEIHSRVLQRDFRRNLYYGREVSQYSAGIVGFGKVGKAIADRLKPFVKKMYVRDTHTQGDVIKHGFHYFAHQNDLLTVSDIVVLAVPLKNNEKMVDRAFLSRLKENCVLVNIARGGLVDKDALEHFLRSHPRAWYYCDVTDPEPDYALAPEEQSHLGALFSLPNVLYTPHIANLTDECQRSIAIAIAEKIVLLCQQKKSL